MKRLAILAPCLLITAFWCVAAEPDADPQTSKTADQTAKVAPPNGSLLPGWLRINASIRGRIEDNITGMKGDVTDTYYLNRIRLDVSVVPLSWLSFFTQLQDARVFGGYTPGPPSGSFEDPFDLRQGWVQLGKSEESGQSIRFGRQEIIYGDGRIIGPGDWSNSGKDYDALRGRFVRPGVTLEMIAGSVVLTNPNGFDWHKPGEHVYGSYNTFNRLLPRTSIEPYYFMKTVLGVTGEKGPRSNSMEDIFGMRVAGKLPAWFDYTLEWVHEGGNYAHDHIDAIGYVYTAGWTMKPAPWKPRISGDLDYASGDSNSKDGVRGTFDLIYGSQQPFFSLTGLVGWKNIRNERAGVDFSPRKNMKVAVDFRNFNLATVQDGFYNAQATRVFLDRAATSAHVGEGVDTKLTLDWAHSLVTTFGVGTLSPGEYLHEVKQYSTYIYPYFTFTKRFGL